MRTRRFAAPWTCCFAVAELTLGRSCLMTREFCAHLSEVTAMADRLGTGLGSGAGIFGLTRKRGP